MTRNEQAQVPASTQVEEWRRNAAETSSSGSPDHPMRWNRRMARVFILLLVASVILQGTVASSEASGRADAPTKLHLSWDQNPKTTMTAQWQTAGATTGDVCDYGPDTQYGSKSSFNTQSTYSGASGQQHVARMENLTAGTQYHYRCGDPAGGMSSDGVFTTAPAAAADFSFVAMGDIGDNSNMRTNVANIDTGAPFPRFFVSTGDNMYNDGTNQAGWDNWFGEWEPLSLKGLALMPSLGNHDVGGGGTTNYKGQFALPGNEEWYTFRYGDVAFIAMNMNTAYGSTSQQYKDVEKWIQEARASGARWIIPYFHQPAYSSGSHGSDMGIRNAYEPMFDKYGVELVLQGHDHNYQRSYPMNASQKVDSCKSVCKDVTGRIWVVTGGGGVSLYDPGSLQSWQVTSAQTYHYSHIEARSNGSLHYRAIDLAKRVIDEFWIVKTGGGGQNNAPATPTVAGPGAGQTNASLSFDVQAADPDNDQVKYTLDWGDGKSDSSGMVSSGTTQPMPHSWIAAGTFSVKAMSTDSKGATSAWSAPLAVTITAGGQNNAPLSPTLAGPTTARVGVPSTFEVTGTDPDNDQVKYSVDWGDTTSGAGQPVASGTKSAFPHAWSAKGTYDVKAKSTDARGLESAWSAPMSVVVTEDAGNPDKTPPVIVHSPVKKAPVSKPISITATVRDDVFVHHVALYWRSESGSWQTTTLFSEPADKFTGEIPAMDVKGAKLYYYLEAADDATNLAVSPTAGDSAPYEVEIEQQTGGGSTGGALGALSAFALPILVVIMLVIAILVIAALAFRKKRRVQPSHPHPQQQFAPWDAGQPQVPGTQPQEWDPNQQGWRQG